MRRMQYLPENSSPEERLDSLKQIIAGFMRRQEELQAKRASATEATKTIWDERLAANTRTIAALQRSAELAEEDVRRSRHM
jgi:hypothetical protein